MMKTFRLSVQLFIICIGICTSIGVAHADSHAMQDTMLWEMQPNESLIELAAKFYPKSANMQRVFIAKTQQLNQDTQVYANANTRYPTTTKIVIPTLKSLSVRGSGTKTYKRSKKSSEKTPQSEQQLVEQKDALDESLEKKNTDIKALEDQMNQLKQQLDPPKSTPTKSKPDAKTP
jgi:septin family protein